MKIDTHNTDGNDQHQVILSPPYKKELWNWLNQHFRRELKEILAASEAVDSYPSADRLQHLIRAKFAQDGIKDAEDLYQLVIGTAAEEYWCEVINEVEDEKNM